MTKLVTINLVHPLAFLWVPPVDCLQVVSFHKDTHYGKPRAVVAPPSRKGGYLLSQGTWTITYRTNS